MRILPPILAALVAFAGGAARPAASSHPAAAHAALSVRISAPHSTVKLGVPIRLRIALTNVSDHQIGFPWLVDVSQDYELSVWTGQGNRVKHKRRAWADKAGRHHTRIRGGSGYAAYLEPGQTLKGEVDVSESYDLSQPGKYTIQASRYDYETKTWVKSNTITITVTAK
jgi:hypothetical protein